MTTKMQHDKEIITNSAAETEELGFRMAEEIRQGGIFCLYGDLGAGKTTFVKGIARGLEVRGEVTSPTFLILKSYEVGVGNVAVDTKSFYHIDLYRTESNKDFETIGLQDVLKDRTNIIVIEWAERLGELMPRERTDIRFRYHSEKRKISIAKHR